MAFGVNPNYIEELYLETFTPQQFLAIAIESAQTQGWHIRFMSDTGFIAYTNLKKFRHNSKFTFRIQGDKAIVKSETTGIEMMDWGRNKRNLTKFRNTFIDIRYSQSPEELEQKYQELQPKLASQEKDILTQPTNDTFLSFFIPRTNYFITPIVVDLNILIFILMVICGVGFIVPEAQSILKWGANFRPSTLDGEWWRLITNFFLHFGIIHLLMNMYALLYIGLLLEPHLGKAKFLAAYFLTGITASVASLWWHELTISAGASGAIFGMYGVFLAMLTTNLIEKTERRMQLTSIGVFVAYNLLNGVNGNIDNAAHIGGLMSGLVIGYAYTKSLKKPEEKKIGYSTIGILSIVILSISCVVYNKIPKDIVQWQKKLESFSSIEKKALEIYKLPRDAPKDELLSDISLNGIDLWNENKEIINKAEKLKIPELLHEKDRKLLDYCDLRLNSYTLIYKKINENTNIYDDSLEVYNEQIQELINSLSKKQ